MEPKKLLVVDDSQANLLLFESMFENDSRVKIITRDNGIDIADYCFSTKPDFILLDLMMPVVNGFEVLDILQADPVLKKIPVVIVSALEGEEDIKKAKSKGALDYIVKPVDYEENYVMILQMLGLDYPPLGY